MFSAKIMNLTELQNIVLLMSHRKVGLNVDFGILLSLKCPILFCGEAEDREPHHSPLRST